MSTYIILIRGINVGGKNNIPMAKLKACLEEEGCQNVITYIQSGNVILQSNLDAKTLGKKIETMLLNKFKSDSSIIKVLVLTRKQLQSVIDKKPENFGEQPDKYHSDVIFLIDIKTSDAMAVFKPRDGVDKIWPGDGAIYSQRLSVMRTKSRLNKIIESPLYKSMTIRNWNTTTKLLRILEDQKYAVK